eukprot:CAMPEP_0170648490 /NCGR_PEP_ID=MMETSP0224-20130122/44764_1 /TAXON_ID=285029 /ORGANISM="Togula jolla, Strain CCCM 725" /LENGTH=163 /DNA_ID=CAMNT_0010980023 /DNA_START=497 /DNA_END=989 /DNA_ORIENTATION=-
MLHGQSPHFQVQRVCLQPSPLHLEAFFASLILHERIVLPLTAVPRARALTLLLITPSLLPISTLQPSLSSASSGEGSFVRSLPNRKSRLGALGTPRPQGSLAGGCSFLKKLLGAELGRAGSALPSRSAFDFSSRSAMDTRQWQPVPVLVAQGSLRCLVLVADA